MMSSIEALRESWTTLYSKTLPQMAKSRDPAQPKWPVTLDHCFARIILDNVVGRGQQQWDKVLSKPAVRNMDGRQLRDAIDLGEKIRAGKVDLCQLDESSLRCRGKDKYAKATASEASKQTQLGTSKGGRKRTLEDAEESDSASPKRARKTNEKQSTLEFWRSQTLTESPNGPLSNTRKKAQPNIPQPDQEDIKKILGRIQQHPSLTPYRKRLYTILCSVPRGRYTTYAAMSDYLNSSARAVGNGMRNNPFAPDCPCHRVLAADGSIVSLSKPLCSNAGIFVPFVFRMHFLANGGVGWVPW